MSDEEDQKNKMEDVRMSNFAFSQIKISDYISFYFAALGVGTAVIASEINFFYNLNDTNKEQIMVMLTISNISTIFLSNHI